MDQYIRNQFQNGQVRFYHAENWIGFQAYLQERAVVGRSHLQCLLGDDMTQFYSDEQDERLGVLGRVFGNLYDFGVIFGRGWPTVPNVYGPIVICFQSGVFSEMYDIMITDKSIVKLDEGWRQSAVVSQQQVDAILSNCPAEPIARQWQFCELSCANDRIPLTWAERIIVEPLIVEGIRLVDLVRSAVLGANLNIPVVPRQYGRPESLPLIQGLVTLCSGIEPPATQAQFSVPEDQLPESVRALHPALRGRYDLWCRYFYYGTLLPLRSMAT